MEAKNKLEYTTYLQDVTNPDLVKVWGIIEACAEAQSKRLTEVDFTSLGNTPQVVPLAVVTYLTSKYQWNVVADNLTGQQRRINKIILI